MTIDEVLAQASGIRLDIGCGENKQPGFVGIDVRDVPGVDIVHDVTSYPWPLPDECAVSAFASHLIEHIPPHNFTFVNFMNEVWRIMKPMGQFAIAAPHGRSDGFIQDPTHCNPVNDATFTYFCPVDMRGNFLGVLYNEHGQAAGQLYNIYKPKPWALESITSHPWANIEVLLRKLPEDWNGER